jgi:putative ABC transport system permease protein
VYLAWNELRRARARFGLLVAAVALLVFLILTQQTLQAGLIDSFVGGIRSQSAAVLVLTVDGRKNLAASVITPDLQQAITSVPGVGASGRFGSRSLGVTAAGTPAQAALVGYDEGAPGAPTTVTAGRAAAAPGEVVASDTAGTGFGLGERVRIDPGGYEVTVVGQASDAQLQASPTLYGLWATYDQAVRASSPDARSPLPSAVAVDPAPGTSADQLVTAINGAVPDADALTREALADSSPGVAQIRQSFQVIFVLYGLVIPLVTGLFFLIVTFQKAGSLTLLRALGVPAGRLVRSLLAQVALVVGGGVAVGALLYLPLSVQKLGSIALRPQTGAIVFWAVLLVALALASALLSARRVLRIDPVTATTGAPR